MPKICPKCNKEWPDEFKACPLDGTPLVSKPQQPAGFSLNLGDANAISGGVNMSDNHSINNTSNVDSHNIITNNITQVEREKSPEEIKHERELAFREACLEVYSNGIMTSEQKRKLEDLQYRLGLDENSASKILSEVAKRSERKSTTLSPVHQITFNNIKTAINSNRLDLVNRLLAQMKAMVQRYSVEEIQFTYYMLQAVLHPKECIEEYENHREDKYWQSFWSSIAYRRVGNIEKSELLVADVGDKWIDTIPQENVFILATVNALIDNDSVSAKSLYDNISGEHSPFLSNLTTCLYTILYHDVVSPEELKQWQKDIAFYSNNLFADIIARNIEAKRLENEAEAKRIAEEKRMQEEAEAKCLAEEKRMQEEIEAKRLAEEKRLQEVAEAKRLAEEKRMQEEAEAKRLAEEKRMQEEAEAKRLAEEKQQIFNSSTSFDIKSLAPYTNKFGYLRNLSDEEVQELKSILTSAPNENYEAKFCLGQLYLQENESAENQKLSYDAIKSASEHGVYEAGAYMAYFYLYGKVVALDLDEAERRIKIDDDYKKNPIFIQMLVDLYTQKGNTMLADVWESKLSKARSLMNIAIYSGYGGGIPVFTIRDNQVFEGYGGGVPVYTIRDNQVFKGYGGGIPVYTIRDNQVFKGYGGGVPVYTIRDNQVFEGYGEGIPVYTIRY